METKERIAFDEMNNKIIMLSQIIQESITAAVQKALDTGFIVTVETASLQPPAMGNYDLAITTRLNRKAQQQLSDFEAAAMASEAKPEANIDCAAGLHSWVSETGIVDPNATCIACGERYGNPD